MSKELVSSIDAVHLLNQRDRVVSAYQSAVEALVEADRLCFTLGFDHFMTSNGWETAKGRMWEELSKAIARTHRRPSRDVEDPNPLPTVMAALTRAVDTAGWERLMLSSGLWSFVDSKRRGEWSESVEKCDVPPLDEANVASTFEAFYDNRGNMLDEGILALFRNLSWDFKSNLPVRLGPKLVLKALFDKHAAGWTMASRSRSTLDDLVRALCQADGRPEPDHRSGASAWAVKDDITEAPWHLYFELKRFKNGNAHVCFHKQALGLVDMINARISQMVPSALPAPR